MVGQGCCLSLQTSRRNPSQQHQNELGSLIAFRGPKTFLLAGTLIRDNPVLGHLNAQKGQKFSIPFPELLKRFFQSFSLSFLKLKVYGLGKEALNLWRDGEGGRWSQQCYGFPPVPESQVRQVPRLRVHIPCPLLPCKGHLRINWKHWFWGNTSNV